MLSENSLQSTSFAPPFGRTRCWKTRQRAQPRVISSGLPLKFSRGARIQTDEQRQISQAENSSISYKFQCRSDHILLRIFFARRIGQHSSIVWQWFVSIFLHFWWAFRSFWICCRTCRERPLTWKSRGVQPAVAWDEAVHTTQTDQQKGCKTSEDTSSQRPDIGTHGWNAHHHKKSPITSSDPRFSITWAVEQSKVCLLVQARRVFYWQADLLGMACADVLKQCKTILTQIVLLRAALCEV